MLKFDHFPVLYPGLTEPSINLRGLTSTRLISLRLVDLTHAPLGVAAVGEAREAENSTHLRIEKGQSHFWHNSKLGRFLANFATGTDLEFPRKNSSALSSVFNSNFFLDSAICRHGGRGGYGDGGGPPRPFVPNFTDWVDVSGMCLLIQLAY